MSPLPRTSPRGAGAGTSRRLPGAGHLHQPLAGTPTSLKPQATLWTRPRKLPFPILSILTFGLTFGPDPKRLTLGTTQGHLAPVAPAEPMHFGVSF